MVHLHLHHQHHSSPLPLWPLPLSLELTPRQIDGFFHHISTNPPGPQDHTSLAHYFLGVLPAAPPEVEFLVIGAPGAPPASPPAAGSPAVAPVAHRPAAAAAATGYEEMPRRTGTGGPGRVSGEEAMPVWSEEPPVPEPPVLRMAGRALYAEAI